MEEKLIKLVHGTLKLPDNIDVKNGGLGITTGWSSLMHIKLILVIEQEFKVKIPSDKIQQTRDFKSLLLLLESLK